MGSVSQNNTPSSRFAHPVLHLSSSWLPPLCGRATAASAAGIAKEPRPHRNPRAVPPQPESLSSAAAGIVESGPPPSWSSCADLEAAPLRICAAGGQGRRRRWPAGLVTERSLAPRLLRDAAMTLVLPPLWERAAPRGGDGEARGNHSPAGSSRRRWCRGGLGRGERLRRRREARRTWTGSWSCGG